MVITPNPCLNLWQGRLKTRVSFEREYGALVDHFSASVNKIEGSSPQEWPAGTPVFALRRASPSFPIGDENLSDF
jgi:hypothetical protein